MVYVGARPLLDPLAAISHSKQIAFGKARCRFHGGLSTGPETKAGRARIAEAQRRRWRLYRERRQLNVVS
jgi:hypothetical protein